MKLTIGALHNLVLGLNAVENVPDVKLAGTVRLAIAINVNLLRPHAEAYERARTRSVAQLYKDNRDDKGRAQRTDAEIQADAMDADAEARKLEAGEFELRMLTTSNLSLEANPKITGGMIAQLAPVITDLS